MEIRRVLPQATQRGRPVRFVCGPRRVASIHTGFTGRMELSGVVISTAGAYVTACACPIEYRAPPSRGGAIEAAGRRLRCRKTVLVAAQCGELRAHEVG